MIEGVIFDMDGVIVDSEEFIAKAAIRMFAEKGINVKEKDFLPFVGTGEDRYIGGVAEKYGVKLNILEAKARTYAIYTDVIIGKLDPLNGVFDFLKTCRDKGLKLALATSADKVKADANLKEIALKSSTFDAIVTGSDIEHKKPAPDIFLKAAKLLGLNPQNCLVVEDAVTGVQAAKSAGCRCLGLTSSFSPEDLKAADWIATDLADAPQECIHW